MFQIISSEMIPFHQKKLNVMWLLESYYGKINK
jgi:hypothetical protein